MHMIGRKVWFSWGAVGHVTGTWGITAPEQVLSVQVMRENAPAAVYQILASNCEKLPEVFC